MPKKMLNQNVVNKIINLRKTGHSLPEIRRITHKGNATVFKYIQGVSVLPEYRDILRAKQGGSKELAKKNWREAEVKSENFLGVLSLKEKILILASLYWAEGNKKDFNIINSDPELIRVVLECLEDMKVPRSELSFSLRIYSDLNQESVIKYWVDYLRISRSQIVSIDILDGKKEGKLKFGMCRVRIKKGAKHFKFIMSVINRIKEIV